MPTPNPHRGAPHQRGLVYRRRVAGAMLTFCGVTSLVGLLALPGANTGPGLVACSLAILALGVPLLARPAAAPPWSSQMLIGAVTVLITMAVSFGGVHDSAVSDLTVMYVLVAIYACYFFPAWLAFGQVAFAGLAYAVLLLTRSHAGVTIDVSSWAAIMATMIVAGLMVRAMNREVEGLVSVLDAAAIHDPLTATLNRRGFAERLDIELTRALRTGEPLTLLAADLDGLKAVNDAQGHAAGDATLEMTARVLGRDLRDVDTLARVGGDEFLVLLPGCDRESGVQIAEKLRTDVAAATLDERWTVSLSIGVVTAPPCDVDADALGASADAALYAAKELGRDRVVGAEEPRRPHAHT